MNKIRGIKLLGIGIVLVIIQSFLQQYDTFREIYSKYVGYLVPVIYAFFITIFLEPIVTIIEKKLKIRRGVNMEIYRLLKTSLDATEIRGKTIANNIANINTPGYKRKYVTFEETLNNINKSPKIEVKEDKSTSIRTDGNNIDLENEKVNQAANTLMYNGLVSVTNTKLAIAKSVITGR